jgi:hypothetical protein
VFASGRFVGARAAILALVVLAAAVSAGAASSARGPAAPATITGAGAANEGAARADADGLLAALSLPAGARPSAGEPSGDGSQLARPAERPATPNLIDVYEWWTVPGTPAEVLSYIEAHPPAGSHRDVRGSATEQGHTSYVFSGFQWPARTGVLGQRELVVELAALPGGVTGVRDDAQVVWLNPRSASETIPRGSTRLEVRITDGLRHGALPNPLTVHNAARIERVTALINGLPLSQPGIVNCPAEGFTLIHLAFYSRGARAPRALALVHTSGCENVDLSLAGQPEPTLTATPFPGSGLPSNYSLRARLQIALGAKLALPRGL